MTLIGHQGQVRRPARSARPAYGSSPLVKSAARERATRPLATACDQNRRTTTSPGTGLRSHLTNKCGRIHLMRTNQVFPGQGVQIRDICSRSRIVELGCRLGMAASSERGAGDRELCPSLAPFARIGDVDSSGPNGNSLPVVRSDGGAGSVMSDRHMTGRDWRPCTFPRLWAMCRCFGIGGRAGSGCLARR